MEKRYPLPGLLRSKLFILMATLFPFFANATGNSSPHKFQPAGFIENVGQIQKTDGTSADNVKFVLREGDLSLFMREDGISYVVTKHVTDASTPQVNSKGDFKNLDITQYRFDLEFVGINKKSRLKGKKKANEFINYYKPEIPAGIKADHFESVTYENIYAGIDLLFYLTDDGQVKYDFIVSPGADPSQISLKWSGVSKTGLNSKGDLELHTNAGVLTEQAPYTYTKDGKEIKSSFTINENLVQFNVGEYDQTQELIIDPTLIWSTYYGASGDDLSLALAPDGSGNIYATGYTSSTLFPITVGAAQIVNNGLSDAFVTKFNSTGSRIWTTYYGGSAEDRGYDITVDGSSNVIVTGYTQSANFPFTTGALQVANAGISDVFVTKFNSSGVVQFSTYIGGASDDYGYGIDTDGSNNIYVAGNSQSNNFPVTVGALQTVHGGGADVFLARLTPAGAATWITYFGGSLGDEAYGLTLDGSGNILITGRAFSTNFPVTVGAYQTSKAGGDDAIIASFTTAGALNWATYFGSTLDDYGNDITLDGSGNIYITGHTASPGFPVTAGAAQSGYGGGLYDGFVSKFNSNATSLTWSTFYGGAGNDQSMGITEDGFGDFYIAGFTNSSNFPVTANALQTTKGTGNDAFLASLSSSGSIVYSTYLGGNNDDYGYDVEWNNPVNLLHTSGATLSTNFPVTSGAFQGSNAGSIDAFIATFCNSIANNTIDISGNDSAEVCVNGPYPLISGSLPTGTGPFTYQWQQLVSGVWTNITGATGQNYQTSNLTSSGTFRRVVTNASCSDNSNPVHIQLNQPPTAGFSVSPACVGEVVSFTDISTSATFTDSIVSQQWSFGDGGTSTLDDPTHIFTSAGAYNVTLIVTSVSGCTDTTTMTINIDTKPNPSFTALANCTTNVVQFNDNSTPTSGFIGFWDWSFGDNTYSQSQNPTHTYPSSGSYTVWLVVTTGGGCKDTIIDTIDVGLPVSAAFNYQAGCSGNATQFTDNSSGGISNWNWNFGDGNTSTVQNPSHTYASAGNYTVTLIVSSPGCADTTTQTITVGAPVNAGFTTSSACGGQTVTFTDTSSTTATITGWNWNFGDGSTSSTQNPVHTYSNIGSYTVILTVTTSDGCTGSATQTLSVGSTPMASFTANGNCSGQNIAFTNTSTGTISSYSWNFGDGGTSTAASPSHVFATAGTYNVTLIVSNGPGCGDTITQPVTIIPGPTASFTANGTCLGSSVPFTNTSVGGTTWNWNFGNGQTSTLQNPTATYSTAGAYTVTLIVGSANGCVDTVTQVINIDTKPVADFSVSNACLNDRVSFTDLSTNTTGAIANWSWNFGDGNTSNLQNPTHTFGPGTTFTVTLIASTANGCADTVTKTITLNDKPVADFTSTGGCAGDEVTFTDISTGAGINSWTWNFGNGNTATTQNPVFSFATGGSYPVQLIVTNNSGCSDTITHTVNINDAPVVDAGANVTIRYGQTIQLSATSSMNGSYNWTPVDGLSNPTISNPSAKPLNTTTYYVTVTTDEGCTGMDSITVTVIKGLEIPSAFTPNGDGSNDDFFLRNIGDYPGAIVQIFNRWGSEIFSSEGYNNPWNGTYKGEPLPAGAYFYVVDLKDGSEPIKGTVTLLK